MKVKKETLRLSLVITAVAVVSFFLGTNADRIASSLSASKATEANKNLPADLDFTEVEKMYDTLRANFDGQLDQTKLMDGIKKGLVGATGDPYTSFLNLQEAELFRSELAGSFSGIGAHLGEENDRPVVIAPIAGYPAEKAGILAGDVILEIDGEDTAPMSLDEAVLKIRGSIGTAVKLKIQRGEEIKDFDIVREEISIPSVSSETIEGGRWGVIRVSEFGDDTNRLIDEEANKLIQSGVQGVILDLRNNPGGRLDSSVHVAGLWLPDKVVVEERRGGKTTDKLSSNGPAPFDGLPTVVLVDGGSASASEIVTGALQDYGVATIIGTKTYGKGSVQRGHDFSSGILKVTEAHWFTPNGRGIDGTGIEPDEVVEVVEGKDAQRERAVQILNEKVAQ